MSKEEPSGEEIFIALRRIIRIIDVNSRRLVLRYGLTSPQLHILQELLRLEEVSVGGLAKSVNLSNGTVTDILDRLEKRNFVQRTRSTADKRRVLVKITPLGLAILKETPSLLQEHFKSQFSQLKDWEKLMLVSSIQRIAEMMESLKESKETILNNVGLTTGESSALNMMNFPPNTLEKEP
ncbi:MAG: MarR family transcriptional regulator [Candidatus Omnitrophica bacterium]|nr:MarR family transcriptional regulator [Candidatus Omnitrophota bacterium]